MFARHRQLLVTGVFLLDCVLLFGSWTAAYALRFYILPLASPLGIPPIRPYLWFGAVLTPLALLILRSFHIYRSARTARLSQEIWTIVQGVAIVTALAALGSYAVRGEIARSVLVLFLLIATFALCGAHLAVRLTLRALRRRGRNLRHVLVVGTGELALRIARKMATHTDYGFEVIGLVSAYAGQSGSRLEGYSVIGSVRDLPALVEKTGAELVYVAL